MTNHDPLILRLVAVRNHFELGRQEFADKAGISLHALVCYERGEVRPTRDTLFKIARNCEINFEWLAEGNKTMFSESMTAPEPLPLRRKLRPLPKTTQIGLRLFKARKDLNLTQAELGQRAGMSASAISSIETGKTQHPRFIVKLALAAEVDVIWLQYGKKPEEVKESLKIKSN